LILLYASVVFLASTDYPIVFVLLNNIVLDHSITSYEVLGDCYYSIFKVLPDGVH
jgi:hypothetical protein